VQIRQIIDKVGSRLVSSHSGQALLTRVVHHLDLWRGYGAGASVATSGEIILFKVLKELLPPTAEVIIFDVGANVGDFTALAVQYLGVHVKIHAFEPARGVFHQLAARFCTDERITVNNIALGREVGERPLFGTSNESGMASLLNRNLNHLGMVSSLQEVVNVCRLSDYCLASGISKIHLLKLDVEGLELEVLSGGESLFEKKMVRMCSFEFGGCNLDSRTFLRDYFEFFDKYNLKIFRITSNGTLVSLPRYHEQLERFVTTNYVAISE